MTAVAGDFTKPRPDIIANSGNKTRLFVGPVEGNRARRDSGSDFIHSETFDVDGDGDLDFIGAGISPA